MTQQATSGTAARASVIRCAGCGKANRVRPVARGCPRCAVCHAPLPWLVETDAEAFDDETRASVPVLVDFWAPWCGPCRVVAPVLEQLARERAGRLKVVKLDVDRSPAIGQRYGVQAIPLLVLLCDGQEIARLAGAAPAPQVSAWLNSHLTLRSAASS